MDIISQSILVCPYLVILKFSLTPRNEWVNNALCFMLEIPNGLHTVRIPKNIYRWVDLGLRWLLPVWNLSVRQTTPRSMPRHTRKTHQTTRMLTITLATDSDTSDPPDMTTVERANIESRVLPCSGERNACQVDTATAKSSEWEGVTVT